MTPHHISTSSSVFSLFVRMSLSRDRLLDDVRTSISLVINLYETLPYVLAVSLFSNSTIRYQWNRLPNIGLFTLRLMRKSAKPLSSFTTPRFADDLEALRTFISLGELSNLRAWTS